MLKKGQLPTGSEKRKKKYCVHAACMHGRLHAHIRGRVHGRLHGQQSRRLLWSTARVAAWLAAGTARPPVRLDTRPVEPDRPGPPVEHPEARRQHPAGTWARSSNVKPRRLSSSTSASYASKQCELLTRLFSHRVQTRITRSDTRGPHPPLFYSCTTVRPGASESWPGGWPLGLRRLFLQMA